MRSNGIYSYHRHVIQESMLKYGITNLCQIEEGIHGVGERKLILKQKRMTVKGSEKELMIKAETL